MPYGGNLSPIIPCCCCFDNADFFIRVYTLINSNAKCIHSTVDLETPTKLHKMNEEKKREKEETHADVITSY